MTDSFALETAAGLSAQILVVVAAAVGIERCLGGAREACRVWTTCFLALHGLFAAALLLPHLRLLSFPSFGSSETLLTIVSWQGQVARIGIMVWLAGVVFSLLHCSLRSIRLYRFVNVHCEALSPGQRARLPLTAASMRSELRILVSDQVSGPFCWQLHRPTIILPSYMLANDERALRHVLLHEIEHLRTNHSLQLLFQQICTTLLWFHPAVWWAARRAEIAREYLCDEVAARSDGDFASYLRTLASVAERSAKSPTCVLAFGRRKAPSSAEVTVWSASRAIAPRPPLARVPGWR